MALFYIKDKNGVFVEVPVIVGRSAYQTAVKNGFRGTESEWLETLRGEPGYTPQKGVDYNDGLPPVKGTDYWTEEDKKEIGDYANAQGADVVSVVTNRTLTADDAGKFFIVGAECIFTIPNLTVGMEVEIFRNTSGNVTLAPDGVNFAIPGNDSLVSESQTISERYGSVVLKQISNSLWSVQGAI